MGNHAPQARGETEQKILDAALKVVDIHTISGTRMHLIAEQAGMSTASLHYHFKIKKDLMMALLQHLNAIFVQRREEDTSVNADDLHGRLTALFNQKKQLIEYDQHLDHVQFDFWTQGQVDPEINLMFMRSFSQWRQYIIKIILMYDDKQDVETLKIVAEVVVSMLMGATMQYLNSTEGYHIDRYFRTCMVMVERYLEELE